MIGTTIGVARAPTLVPALNSPVAKARSRCGNHSAMLRTEPGKMAASPSPSRTRQKAKPATDADIVSPRAPKAPCTALPMTGASAWSMAATLQRQMAMASPRRVPIRSISQPEASMPTM